ncbi:uncharacterized protein LOC143275336 [Babylonia areolata]|uniref:uncharacterized protein LOC143275336 n=1 Tax=Babylonia areolata TaxID=304850 RepID=UPI003FD2001C
MGVPDRTVLYESGGHAAHNHWSSSTPVSLTTTPSPPQPQPQQQQHQHQQYDGVPPPPYPGHCRQLFSNLPGFRQSYSGSDTSTDMSLSSTENLASWPRQDPQGEETMNPSSSSILLLSPQPPHGDAGGLTRHVQSSCTASQSPGGSMERLSPLACTPCSSSSSFSSSSNTSGGSGGGGGGHCQTESATSTSSSSSSSSSSGGDDSSGSVGHPPGHHVTTVRVPPMAAAWHHHVTQDVPPPHSERYFPRSLTPTYHHPHPYVNQMGEGPLTYTTVPFLPPPPQYPGCRGGVGERKAAGGKGRCLSDPVSTCGPTRVQPGSDSGVFPVGHLGSSSSSSSSSSPSSGYVFADTIFSAVKPGSSRVHGGSQGSADQVVSVLHQENRRLQEELVHCHRKIAKLQKLEQEIHQVQEAYQSLVRSTDKRERLEAAIKARLKDQVSKLQAHNDSLKVQLQKAGPARKLRSRSEGRGAQRAEKDSTSSLKQMVQEKQSKVEQLESDIEQWERRYSELQTAQQAGHSAQCSWCDCSSEVAKSSQSLAQRLGEETHSDKLQYAEQLAQSQRRVTELEAKVSWLQNRLLQKDQALKDHHQHQHQHQHHQSSPSQPPPPPPSAAYLHQGSDSHRAVSPAPPTLLLPLPQP